MTYSSSRQKITHFTKNMGNLLKIVLTSKQCVVI